MKQTAIAPSDDQQLPVVSEITFDNPWFWLAKGWNDIISKPMFSLSYGVVFFAFSVSLTLCMVYSDWFFFIPPITAGFFLVAPILGIGLYQISATIQKGQQVKFCQALDAWNSNPVHLAGMCIMLVFIMLVWMMVANLVFALFYDQPIPTWDNFIAKVFLSGESFLFLFAGILSGGIMALFTFSVSVITVPLLIDRQIDLMTAVQTSMRAVRLNWRPMMLWASLIVMFAGIGILTFFVGLIVTMPLVGHATWHAYQDLIEQPE